MGIWGNKSIQSILGWGGYTVNRLWMGNIGGKKIQKRGWTIEGDGRLYHENREIADGIDLFAVFREESHRRRHGGWSLWTIENQPHRNTVSTMLSRLYTHYIGGKDRIEDYERNDLREIIWIFQEYEYKKRALKVLSKQIKYGIPYDLEQPQMDDDLSYRFAKKVWGKMFPEDAVFLSNWA